MSKVSPKKTGIVLIHAFIGWALCGATMGIGRAITSAENTLIIHALFAPIFFAIISTIYYKRFNFASPLLTAGVFLSFVILMDAGLVAPVFEKSYAMFRSFLGTWIPFTLIFLSSYITGLMVRRRSAKRTGVFEE